MGSITVRPLDDSLSFGARISGVTEDMLQDQAVREQLNAVFEDRGMIIFEDVEPSGQMHVALSNVFGPLKDHPVKTVERVDQDAMPGVIDMKHNQADPILVEIEGVTLAQWLPWHFDHCYNNELNRAGVLRAIDIPPEGGLTGFCDGVQLYRDFSPELLKQIEDREIVYTLNVVYDEWKFGKPATFKSIHSRADAIEMNQYAKTLPRAVHPAVWTRQDGRKVMHTSPWMAEGISGQETPDGDQLLEAVCQEVFAKAQAQAYFHQWKTTDMLIWDNWRMLHCVSGADPRYNRRMQRTTIKGDYGLGRFEEGARGDALLEHTMV
ncbi:TauD/TfdA family dioxygenase [Phenylobacterium sp. LjRoot219]|uniref:TauD/TfdA dioxygenase family protein n=1 Tax=Phenylobacterium sp. LjRoot219 TaxID=3342283 RepID=UPI003ECC8BDB